jgi:hypothetical protein
MEVVILTFNKVGSELIANIPEFVEITASMPSMIFFTLDGTLPTVFSSQYTGSPIEMPADVGQVTLTAIAYFLDGYANLVPSPILSETYTTDTEGLNRVRNLSFEGVTYIYPGGLDIPFWYDSAGDPVVFIDIPIEDLEKQLIPSERNKDGSIRDKDNIRWAVRDLVPFDETITTRDGEITPVTSPEDPDFDPRALFIIIDGRSARDTDAPLLFNSPFMVLRDPERNFGGLDFVSTDGSNYISGGLTKPHYNREKEIIVFYYYDSNVNRWVKSIQNLPRVNKLNFSNAIITNPVVFEWNNFGRHQAV